MIGAPSKTIAAQGRPSPGSSPPGTGRRDWAPPLGRPAQIFPAENHGRGPHDGRSGRKGVASCHGCHPLLDAPRWTPMWRHWPPTDAAEPPRSTTSNPPLFPRQADGGHNCFLFFVVLIRGTKRGLTVLIRGNILITSAPPSRLGIDAVALGDLRRFPRLVAVLSPLELGRGDAVPCPLLRQWRAGHRHGPAPSLQKQQVSCKKGGNKTGRYLTGQ